MMNMTHTTKSNIRYTILFFLFIATVFNYADRATLSVVAPIMGKELHFSPTELGWAFSAFGFSYVALQIPGGYLLDRFGSRLVYGTALIGWSIVTMFQGTIFLVASPFLLIMTLRLLMGAIEAPAFPANSRLSVQWFPEKERGVVTSIYQSAQYISLGLVTPLMTWILHSLSRHYVFYFIGIIGVVIGFAWLNFVKDPINHPKVNDAEIQYIRQGGGSPDLGSTSVKPQISFTTIKQACFNRMMIGVYIGQFCLTSITWFFLTWFPTYLYQERGMSMLKIGLIASIPAIAGFAGGLFGGYFSDRLLKKGHSLTIARKIPIILGMMASTSIIICNYTDSNLIVILAMSVSFFAKGFGNLGWCVLSDTSPKSLLGVAGGIFNTCGNLASILTPLIIGYIVSATESYQLAILYIGSMGIIGLISYIFVVGPLNRLEVDELTPA